MGGGGGVKLFGRENREAVCHVCSPPLLPLGIDEPLPLKKRKITKPGFTHSPWKSAYIRQHRIDTNWRRGDLKSPKVACFFYLLAGLNLKSRPFNKVVVSGVNGSPAPGHVRCPVVLALNNNCFWPLQKFCFHLENFSSLAELSPNEPGLL